MPALTPATRDETTRLYLEHGAFVWRILRHHGVPDSDLEDACQEVFMVVQRRIDGFVDDGRASVTTWLYAITWRVAKAWQRRVRRRREVPAEQAPETTAEVLPDETVDRRQMWRRLVALLDELPEPQRAVFVLFEIEELDMQAVADALGCPRATAYQRLYAARRKLRAALEGPKPKKGTTR